MIIQDKYGSTTVSELVNIYTMPRKGIERKSNEYEKHEIMFEFRRTHTKDLIVLFWFEVEKSLGEKAYLKLICDYYKTHTKNRKCLLPKDDYHK
jgi:hypothetical protein